MSIELFSESDLDADDEANNSGEVKNSKEEPDQVQTNIVWHATKY